MEDRINVQKLGQDLGLDGDEEESKADVKVELQVREQACPKQLLSDSGMSASHPTSLFLTGIKGLLLCFLTPFPSQHKLEMALLRNLAYWNSSVPGPRTK